MEGAERIQMREQGLEKKKSKLRQVIYCLFDDSCTHFIELQTHNFQCEVWPMLRPSTINHQGGGIFLNLQEIRMFSPLFAA